MVCLFLAISPAAKAACLQQAMAPRHLLSGALCSFSESSQHLLALLFLPV